MFEWLREPVAPIELGSVWSLQTDGNPFNKPVLVTVVDVKEGFVQYRYNENTWSDPSSLSEKSFRSIYNKVEVKHGKDS